MSTFYKHNDKTSGDGLAITDWNELSNAVAGNQGLHLALDATDNVGIGTNDPQAKLHIGGTIDDVDLNGTGGGFIIGSASGQHLAMDVNEIMSKSNGTTVSTLHLNREGGTVSICEFGGNVGIGTTIPNEKLEVNGKVKATKFEGDGSELTNLNAIKITTGTLAAARIPNLNANKITTGTLAAARIPNLNANKITTGKLAVDRLPDGIAVASGGNTTFTGHVGIGTEDPKAKLHIGGTIDDVDLNGTGGGFIIGSASGQHLAMDVNEIMSKSNGTTVSTLHLNREGGTVSICEFGGNVGIGTNDPTQKLHVTGDSDKNVGITVQNVGTGNSQLRFLDADNKEIGAITLLKKEGGGVAIHDGKSNVLKIQDGKLIATLNNIGDHQNVQYNSTTHEIGYDNSSRRYKENIKQLSDDFSKILEIEPKTYTRPNSPNRWELGYIAEEFDDLGLNRLVYYDEEGRPDSINYTKITLYVVEVLKQLKSGMKVLEVDLEKLTKKVATLAKKVK